MSPASYQTALPRSEVVELIGLHEIEVKVFGGKKFSAAVLLSITYNFTKIVIIIVDCL